ILRAGQQTPSRQADQMKKRIGHVTRKRKAISPQIDFCKDRDRLLNNCSPAGLLRPAAAQGISSWNVRIRSTSRPPQPVGARKPGHFLKAPAVLLFIKWIMDGL